MPVSHLTLSLATTSFLRAGPGAWERCQPRTLAQDREVVLVIAWWALAGRQGCREPEATSRLASPRRSAPIPAMLHTDGCRM